MGLIAEFFIKTKKMKLNIVFRLLIVFVFLLGFNSCERDRDFVEDELSVKAETSDIDTELLNLSESVLGVVNNQEFRDKVYERVSSKFDGDYNALFETLRSDMNPITLKSTGFQKSMNYFNARSLFPQIYIPHFEDLKASGKLNKESPVVLIYTDEKESGSYPGYRIDEKGQLTKLDFLIDEEYAKNNEVWVISINERVDEVGRVVYKPDDLKSLFTFDINQGESVPNVLKSASGCATPPATPTNVQAFPMNPYSVNIQWQESPSAIYYKIYREVNYDGNFAELATVNYPQSSYSDNFLSVGNHYDYKLRAFSGEDCYSVSSFSKGAYATWRTTNFNDILYRIYISDACWNWCCSWPEGDIELKYRIVKYNKSDQVVEYPKNSLPSKSKSSQKGKWCLYDRELFRWDITKYAYNYMLFFYEDDGGNDAGLTIKLTAKFEPTDAITVGAEISFTIDDKDEELGWMEIHHYDSWGKVYNMSPRKGSAQMTVRQ
jgi:hypothetical protein